MSVNKKKKVSKFGSFTKLPSGYACSLTCRVLREAPFTGASREAPGLLTFGLVTKFEECSDLIENILVQAALWHCNIGRRQAADTRLFSGPVNSFNPQEENFLTVKNTHH